MAGVTSYTQYAGINSPTNVAAASDSQPTTSTTAVDGTPPETKIESARSENLSGDNAPIQFPADLSPDFYISFNAFKFSQDRPDEAKRTFSLTKSINLPFPGSITDQFGARYDQENLFFGGEALRGTFNDLMTTNGTKKVENIFSDTSYDKLANQLSSFTDRLTDSSERSRIAAAGATYLMTGVGGAIGAAAKTAFQVTTNPYPVAVYSGTGFKNFGFSWTFYPETKEESDIIRKIVGYFRREMLPEQVPNTPSILKTPAIFEVSIKPDTYLKKFKRCVVTGLDVNYAPSGPSFVKSMDSDPAPAAVSMTINLQEIELWLANDFEVTEEAFFDYK